MLAIWSDAAVKCEVRLDNEDDLVRAEIAAALTQRIPVIPVVVQNAAMPIADDLPEDIRLLARRKASNCARNSGGRVTMHA